MAEPSARGSNGGKARKEKLSPERRKEIAQEAAKKRWANKREEGKIPVSSEEKNQELDTVSAGEEEKHILAMEDNVVTVPIAIQEADTTVAAPAPPAPSPKPSKRQAKPMPREFKTASSYAEKRLLQAVKEKADHVGEIEKHTNAIRKLDTEISELVPIIRALGGKIDTQAGPQQQFNPNPSYQHSFPPIPSQLEENTPSIDPALFHANSGPVPKTASMNQNPIMIPGAPIGGTEELNYSPEADIRWV